MAINLHIPSPIDRVAILPDCFIDIKRDDLIHPSFGGNKWRKLSGNIVHFKHHGYKHILTFGGAFSNHIAATAAIGAYYNMSTIGIIRGEYADPNNPTLIKARAQGMTLYHIAKQAYRQKTESKAFLQILDKYPNSLVIPEGGSNAFALEGLADLAAEINTHDYQHIVVACGTGMTAAGIIKHISPKTHVHVINVLKNVETKANIASWVGQSKSNWTMYETFHCGGFAKTNESLQSFARTFYKQHKIKLDPIYNAKSMLALHSLIENKIIPKEDKVIYIHTGGHQGINGYDYMHQDKWLSTSEAV